MKNRLLRMKKPAQIVDLHGKPMNADMRAYEASSTGRRLGKWDAPQLSPNNAATSEMQPLQQRSRASNRNNPWIARALKVNAANEVGTGIIPRSRAKDKAFRAAIRQWWDRWSPYADADGVLNAYGIQWLSILSRREAGEVFIRKLTREASPDVPIALQLQVLESDFCPVTYTHVKAPNGNDIISGIEFDKKGRRAAYWMYETHPAELGWNSLKLVRIPADQVIHHFRPLRPGQLRAVPENVQALTRAYVYDKYEDAELNRKENRANFTGVIKRNEYSQKDWQYDPFTGEPISTDGGGVPMLELEPGTFPNLLPGEDVTLFPGDETGNGYADFQRQQLLAIAAGQDCPYELTTGDYSKINDRLWRALMNQYQREMEQIQDLFDIHQICRQVWNWFCDAAVLAGVVDALGYEIPAKRHDYIECEHKPQAWKYIHPLQDVQGKALEVAEGFKARQEVIAEAGEDAETVDEQRKEDQDREKSLGLSEQQVSINNGDNSNA